MRKLFLLLCLGICLISFTSATINVYGNTTRPIFNVELVEDDGNNLLEDNTNYYFQCFIGNYGYAGMSHGPASEEFNITTDSTHRWINLSNFDNMCANYVHDGIFASYRGVHCRWSANRSFKDWGGEGYMPWAFDNNETGVGHTQWMAKYANPGNYWGSEMKCNQNKDSIILNTIIMPAGGSNWASRYVHHPEIAVPMTYRDGISRSYNVTQGGLYIVVDDDHTYEELADAIVDSGFSDLYHVTNNEIALLGTIKYSYKSMVFSRKVYSKTLWLDGFMNNLEFNDFSNIIYDLPYPYVYSTGWYGTFRDSSITSTGTMRDYLDGATLDNTNICFNSPSHGGSASGFNSLCNIYSSIYLVDGEYLYNVNFYNNKYHYVLPNGLTGHYTSYFENITYNDGVNSYDIQGYPGYIKGCHNQTRNYDMKNVVSNRADGRPIIQYNGAYPPEDWCDTSFNFSFHGDIVFKILDEDGNGIENVNITLTNEFNTYTNLTSATGNLIHDTAFYLVYYNSSAILWNDKDAVIEKGTYNLTISKDGYSDYSTKVTLGESQDWTIALESRDWNYSKSLAWKILNSTGTTVLKLSNLGNLAIAGNLYENTNTAPDNVIYKIANVLWLTQKGDLYLVKELMEMII